MDTQSFKLFSNEMFIFNEFMIIKIHCYLMLKAFFVIIYMSTKNTMTTISKDSSQLTNTIINFLRKWLFELYVCVFVYFYEASCQHHTKYNKFQSKARYYFLLLNSIQSAS